MHACTTALELACGCTGGSARKLADWVATRPGGARRATLDVPVDVGVAEPLVKKHHLHPRVVVVKEQSPVPVKKEVIVKQSPVVVKQKPVVQKVRPDQQLPDLGAKACVEGAVRDACPQWCLCWRRL